MSSSRSPFSPRSSLGRAAFAPIRRRLFLATSAAALALTLGCSTEPSLTQPPDTTKYTLENTDKFAVLDDTAEHAVTCTGLQQHALADGRLEVIANLKNRENRKLEVQASCLFRNAEGAPAGGETKWQKVALAENATVAVRFTAPTPAAKKYTVQVRQAP